MESQSIAVKKNEELTVVMRESTNTLNEVVKIGYATSSRKDLTGSISSLDTRIIESSAASTITQMIQGQLPGVSVTWATVLPVRRQKSKSAVHRHWTAIRPR